MRFQPHPSANSPRFYRKMASGTHYFSHAAGFRSKMAESRVQDALYSAIFNVSRKIRLFHAKIGRETWLSASPPCQINNMPFLCRQTQRHYYFRIHHFDKQNCFLNSLGANVKRFNKEAISGEISLLLEDCTLQESMFIKDLITDIKISLRKNGLSAEKSK